MFAVSLSIDMYETKIINRKKSFKVRENWVIKYGMDFTKALCFNTFLFQIKPIGEAFDCRWCDRSFSKAYNLMIHERCHITSFHQCDGCGKRFRSKEKMKNHRWVNIRYFSKVFFLNGIFPQGCSAPHWLLSPRPRPRRRSPDWWPSARCTKCCDKRKLIEQQQIHSGDSLCQMKL